MPSGNKPKRFDRAWAWRVARRKKDQKERMNPTKRTRGKRPKNKLASKLKVV